MIKFFRKIRYNLMEQNKTGKYLKYAIGEIVLVVIGILIALSINNWNQQKEQQKTIKIYLANFIEDLKGDIEVYKSLEDATIFKFHSLQHLLTMIDEKPVNLRDGEYIKPLTIENFIWNKPLPNEPNYEFIDLCFLWSIRVNEPVINMSSLNDLNSTGTFSFIENKNLKDAINNYYYHYEWRLGNTNSEYQQTLRINWLESLLKSGVLPQDMSNVEEPLELIRNNPERIGHIRVIIRASWFRAVSLVVMHKNALELIELIESEISK